MSDDCKNIVYEHKLQILQDQNLQLMRQIGFLKQSNEALMSGLANLQNLKQENCKLALQNHQLNDQLQTERRRSQDLQNRLEHEIKSLKEQLHEKINYIERIKIQHEKQIFKVGDELRKSKIQQRQQRYDNMEDRLAKSSMAVSSCLVDLKAGEENSFDYSNRMSYMNLSNIERNSSKIIIPSNSRLSEFKKDKPQLSRIRGQNDFKAYTKEELKTAIKTLNKAGKSLREGSMQMSMMRKSQSFLKKSGL